MAPDLFSTIRTYHELIFPTQIVCQDDSDATHIFEYCDWLICLEPNVFNINKLGVTQI